MIRRLVIFLGCFCIVGILRARAQTPVADFSASVTSGCGPLSVSFKDASTNTPLYWSWDFGNGQTSTLQNPSVNYSAPGTYTVTLIARNKSGADAIRKSDYITVFPYPKADFTSNLTLACAPTNVQFTDQSTSGQGAITSWSWDFGDGATSDQPSPSHVYSQTGYFNVTLKVMNSGGCSNAVGKGRYLRIVDGIQPNFTWDQTSTACPSPFVLNFVNQTAGPGNLVFAWTLGNGASPAASSDTSPVNITYPTTGNYDVTLQVTSDLGCSGSIKQTIPLSNSTASIIGPDITCINTPVTFTNGSTPPPVSATWDFGDGTTSTDLNPSKSYTANGTYTITLTNVFPSCSGTATKTVQVSNPPTPVFTADKTVSCTAPLTVQFTDQTTPVPAQWLWDFGDGQTSTDPNPVHQYMNTGIFTVTLTTTNSGGCSNSTTQPQFIKMQAPSVSLADASGLGACIASTPGATPNNVITPIANVNAVDGVISYLWDAPGASPATSGQAQPSFMYAAPGQYPLTLTITTTGGCTATATFNNVVNIGTPITPAIIAPATVCGTNKVTFSEGSTPINELKWLWDFGDGFDTLTNNPSIDHSYNNIGPKTVGLILIHNGCPQPTSKTITVNPPIAGFSYAPDCANNKYEVAFTDTSKIAPVLTPPLTYLWDFGDGSPTSAISSPTHMYPATPADYTVSLTVSEGNGCSSTITTPIHLGPIPFDFTYPTTLQCRGVPIHLTATSPNPELISGYAWHWDLDPQTPFSASPSIDVSNNTRGLHRMWLIIHMTNGCLDSISHDILISYPTATFTPPAGGCKNSTLPFTGMGIPDPGTGAPIKDWVWDFGDKTTAPNSPNVTHQYADTGFFYPALTIMDQSGCGYRYAAPTPIHITSPIANFNGPDSFYCPKTPFVFKDLSIGNNMTDNWTYGDGTPDDPIGTHAYANNGNYDVTLTVTDQFLCQDHITKPIRIQQPIAAFDIADTTAICAPLQTKFNANGQYYDSLYWSFGDGTTSTLPVTSHFYNTTDTFYAKLFLRGPGGCFDSAARRVLVLDPHATTTFNYGPPYKACDSLPVQFDITPPGYTRFTLNFGDALQALDSSQNPKPFHMYRSPGTYGPSLVLVDATGCIVNIGGPTAIIILGSVPFISLDPHAFCDSSTVTFTDYTISNDGIVSETLNFGDGSTPLTQATGQADLNTDHFYSTPGIFLATLHVTTTSNCAEDYTDTVHVYQTPHPVITGTSPFCIGPVQFSGSTTVPVKDSIAWSWDFGNGQTAKDKDPGTTFSTGDYTVTLITAVPYGCKDTTTQQITIHALPEVHGPAEISTAVGFPVTIPFTYSAGVNNWVWTPTDHLDCSDCANPAATLIFKQEYEVTIKDTNNCVSSGKILIRTICNDKNYFIPNTFSPNGDGVNDYFYPRGSNLYNIQSLRVFNRWGQLVFERKNFPANAATMGWDGTINGRPAPVDAYVYIAEVVCDNAEIVALHGDVTLVR